jgi:hypothetical protein
MYFISCYIFSVSRKKFKKNSNKVKMVKKRVNKKKTVNEAPVTPVKEKKNYYNVFVKLMGFPDWPARVIIHWFIVFLNFINCIVFED